MDKATAQNARMWMWSTGEFRGLALDFPDRRQVSTIALAAIWDAVVSIALRGAPVALRTLMIRPVGPQVATNLPVCPETLSVLRLLRLVQGLEPPIAKRVAEGWMQVPLQDRAEGNLDYQCTRVVNIQLLGLIEPSSPVLATQMPDAFSNYLAAAHYAGLSANYGPCWRAGRSFLGSTCLAFVGPRDDGLRACLAMSDCKVSYPMPEGGGLPEARTAVQMLISYLPKVIVDTIVLRLAGWNPIGHEVLEVAAFLDDLKNTLAQAAPERRKE